MSRNASSLSSNASIDSGRCLAVRCGVVCLGRQEPLEELIVVVARRVAVRPQGIAYSVSSVRSAHT